MEWSDRYNQYVRRTVQDLGLQDERTFNDAKKDMVIEKGSVLYDIRYGVLYQAVQDIVLKDVDGTSLVGHEPGSLFSVRENKAYDKRVTLTVRNMELPTKDMVERYSISFTV